MIEYYALHMPHGKIGICDVKGGVFLVVNGEAGLDKYIMDKLKDGGDLHDQVMCRHITPTDGGLEYYAIEATKTDRNVSKKLSELFAEKEGNRNED